MTNAPGRPSGYRPEYDQQVIDHLAQGCSLASFAGEVGVSRCTIDNWRSVHPSFDEAVGIAKAKCVAWWERNARTVARTGKGNANITLFMLKNFGPDDFTEKSQVEHVGAVPVVQYSIPANGRDAVRPLWEPSDPSN